MSRALRLLGRVTVVGADGPQKLDGQRPMQVLLALYVAGPGGLSVDELAERCFSDTDRPTDPSSALRTAIRRVRRALGDDAVITRSGAYTLDLRDIDVDAVRFEQLITEGRAETDARLGGAKFAEALDLWHGRPFDGHDVDWLELERFRLEELHLLALESWFAGQINSGSVTEILPRLEATAAAHPLRERFHRQLMHALFVADRQAEALRAFQRHREALIDAGLEASSETMALERRILESDPSLRPAGNGRQLRGYRLEESIGEGGFAVVYRGVQPTVGREVAIKQIRSELANQPDFIQSFEAEAQLVARLEHPHIVPLYDFWREPGSAYLVMRYLRGGNLSTRIRAGALPVAAVRRLLEQVGSALAAAHRSGVVHRDVKSANILLDEEGNAYLSDFGIARDAAHLLDPDGFSSAGSPAYASPEQLRRETVAATADIHGLGIVIYEALVGRLPFADTDRASLIARQLHETIPSVSGASALTAAGLDPEAIDEVLQKATAKSAADRYQSVETFVTELSAVLGSRPGDSEDLAPLVHWSEERNPYKGLRAFEESDADDFSGRSALVDQIVGRLGEHRMVTVVGASGSGKSSVVRAGVLPRVRRGELDPSLRWLVATMVPSSDPFAELEAALLALTGEARADVRGLVRAGEQGMVAAFESAVGEGSALVLVIDQLEEAFTRCEDEVLRSRFLDALAAAVTSSNRLWVLATLRADFLDRPLAHPGIGRLVSDATVLVLPMGADALEVAMTRPAASVGCTFEPGLVSEIVADVVGQPGALPMLQYTLTELWERRVARVMTHEAYEGLGGAAGALARTADELFDTSDSSEQAAVRRVFGRLVNVGSGQDDTRRRVRRSEVGGTEAVDAVIERYGAARLLSFDHDPTTREPTVEIAHEALLAAWPRLRGWLDEDREKLRLYRQLADAAGQWNTGGRDDSDLYRGPRLALLEESLEASEEPLTGDEQGFFEASKLAERAAEEQATRRRRRQFGVAAAVTLATSAVAAIALVFFVQARNESRRADEGARQATALSLAAQSDLVRSIDPTLSLAMAAEAVRLEPSADAPMAALFEARLAFGFRGGQPVGDPLVGHTERVDGLAVSPDSRLVASGAADGTVRLWDAATGAPVGEPLVGHTDWVEELAFSPDGTVLASASDDATVRLWDPVTGDPVGEPLEGHTDFVWAVDFHPDGNLLASGADDGTVRLWDPATGEAVGEPLVGHAEGILGVAFSPDGSLLASSSRDGTIRRWDPATGEPVGEPLVGHEALVLAIAFSPDGALLASAGGDGTVRIWDSATGVPVGDPYSGHVGQREVWVYDVAFSPDGSTVASGGSDGLIRLWDPLTGQAAGQPLTAGTTPVLGLAFSPDGSRLVSAHFDEMVRLWDPTPGSPADAELSGHESGVLSTVFNTDGSVLLSSAGVEDPTVRLWNPATGTLLGRPLSGHRDAVTGVAVHPEGATVATASADGTIRRWDLGDRTAVGDPLIGHQGSVSAVHYSHDGVLLVSAGADGYLRRWDSGTGEPVGDAMEGHDGSVLALALHPSKDVGASGGADGTVRLWNIETGEPIGEPLTGHTDPVVSVAFNLDGSLLATASEDRTIRLWNAATGAPVGEPLEGHTDFVWAVAFHPDGDILASGGREGAIRLWEVPTGRPLGQPLFTHSDAVVAVAFSPDGDRLASASRDTTVRVLSAIWDVDEACSLLEPHLARIDLAPFVADGVDPELCRT